MLYTEDQLKEAQAELAEIKEGSEKTIADARAKGKDALADKIQALVDALAAFTPEDHLDMDSLD